VAQQVLPPCHAARTENRQGGHGPELAVHLYWMWRQGWDYGQINVSVRTRENPEIAMVSSQSPT
jgi:hypothetical protein